MCSPSGGNLVPDARAAVAAIRSRRPGSTVGRGNGASTCPSGRPPVSRVLLPAESVDFTSAARGRMRNRRTPSGRAHRTAGSPERVVDGTVLPHQYLYNTVEGGGRTVAVGSSGTDLPAGTRQALAELALAGRLLQSHFSTDDPDDALDVEWLMTGEGAFQLVQVRPYAR